MKSALLAFACLATATAAPAARAETASVDPACMEAVGWEVDPGSEAIRVHGCRPASEIPAPDPDGFITYNRPPVDGTDAGFLRAKLISVGADGALVFEVQDNGGGSGAFGLRVTGTPNAEGVIAAGTAKIDLLGGS